MLLIIKIRFLRLAIRYTTPYIKLYFWHLSRFKRQEYEFSPTTLHYDIYFFIYALPQELLTLAK